MPRIRWDGDAASAERAQEALTAAVQEFRDETGKAVIKQKEMDKAAQRIAEQANPQERYNRKMKELAQLVSAGKISLDNAALATQKYQRELERAGQSGQRAFGAGMLGQITGLVAGYASISTVVNAITTAFQNAEQAAQAAADAIFDSLGAVGELGQLGAEGPRGLSIARELVRGGVVKPTNRTQAVEIAANIINAGLTEDQQNFIVRDLAGAGGKGRPVKPENLVTVAGNLKGLMTQFGETDMRDMGRRVLGAANKTKADLAITSREILKFGELSAASGFGLNESLAAFFISQETGASAESAAEMQKSFMSQIFRRGLAKGTLAETVENIRSQIPKGGTAFDVLGDANAVIGYSSIAKDVDKLRRTTAEITATPRDIIPRAGEILQNDPVYRAADARARAEGRLAAEQEKHISEKENLMDALRAERSAISLAEGESAITRAFRDKRYERLDAYGQEREAFVSELAGMEGTRVSPELQQAMIAFLARMADGIDELNGKRSAKETTKTPARAKPANP